MCNGSNGYFGALARSHTIVRFEGKAVTTTANGDDDLIRADDDAMASSPVPKSV